MLRFSEPGWAGYLQAVKQGRVNTVTCCSLSRPAVLISFLRESDIPWGSGKPSSDLLLSLREPPQTLPNGLWMPWSSGPLPFLMTSHSPPPQSTSCPAESPWLHAAALAARPPRLPANSHCAPEQRRETCERQVDKGINHKLRSSYGSIVLCWPHLHACCFWHFDSYSWFGPFSSQAMLFTSSRPQSMSCLHISSVYSAVQKSAKYTEHYIYWVCFPH